MESDGENLRNSFVNGWPAGETDCGIGSRFDGTWEIRAALPLLMKQYGVQTLNDAGCGDLNWIQHVDLTGIDYVGYDVIRRSTWCQLQNQFTLIEVDVTSAPMRPCDLTIRRDVLAHLPNRLVHRFLCRCKQTSRYLLTTNYPGASNKDREIAPGDFAPLDLLAVPFSLDSPVETVRETQWNRHVCLWNLLEEAKLEEKVST